MDQLEIAKQILTRDGYTCVITDGVTVHTSKQRGVAPLLALYDNQIPVAGFVAADKVVGKAAAFLYVLLGVRWVYAGIISTLALEVFAENGIEVRYDTLVEGIRNRTDTGPCPMENATASCTTPTEALAAIRETLQKLRSNGSN